MKIHKTKGQRAIYAESSTLETKERLGSMERTITQSGALYFVQHKETVTVTPQRRSPVPRIWSFRVRSVRHRLPKIRLPRMVLYREHRT